MYDWIMKKQKLVIGLVIGFSIITRTIDIIPAILLYMVVYSLPIVSDSRRTLNILSIVNLIIIIVLGLISFVVFSIQVIDLRFYTDNTIVWALPIAIFSFLAVLIQVIMLIVYLVKEEKEWRDVLFMWVLILPIIGVLYTMVDGFVVNALINFFLNLEQGSSTATMDLGATSLFTIIKVVLLVYLLVKAKEQVHKEIYTEETGR